MHLQPPRQLLAGSGGALAANGGHVLHHLVRRPSSTHAAATEALAPSADEALQAAAAARVRGLQHQQQQQQSSRLRQGPPPSQQQQQQQQEQQERQMRPRSVRLPRAIPQQQQQRPYHSSGIDTRQQPGQARPPRQQPYYQQQQYQQQYQHPAADHPQQPPQQQQRRQQRRGSSSQRPYGSIPFALGSSQDWRLPTGLAVTWLGTSSGAPSRERNISCTLVRSPEAVFLVDCGEGSHRQAALTGVDVAAVDTLFITHLHGDHCFGIGGMLTAISKARTAQQQQQQQGQGSRGQQQPQQGEQQQGALAGCESGPEGLRLVGPPRLGELLAAMLGGAGLARRLELPVFVTELVEEDSQAHGWQPLPGAPRGSAFVRRLAPQQRLPPAAWPADLKARLQRCRPVGQYQDGPRRYRQNQFDAKPGLAWSIPCQSMTVTAAQLQHRVPCWGYVFEELPPAQQQQSQQQQQPPLSALLPAPGCRRVLILGDTMDSRAIAPLAAGADLVSHEATFARGMEAKAFLAQHSTAYMAGQFAWAIRAKALVLTHFSARYEGSAGEPVPGHGGPLALGGRGGRPAHHRPRASEAAEAAARAAAAEEQAVVALQREAEESFREGPVLLARDLFTAHVPRLKQSSSGSDSDGDA